MMQRIFKEKTEHTFNILHLVPTLCIFFIALSFLLIIRVTRADHHMTNVRVLKQDPIRTSFLLCMPLSLLSAAVLFIPVQINLHF